MPAHILIVDDDPLLAKLLTFVLPDSGYRATAVADPGAVVPLLAGGEIDLVLLDITLPGGDGRALLTAIRRAAPALPVIFLSARGTLADRVAGLEQGADDYVAKPFEPIELLARIRAVLGRSGTRGGGDRRAACAAPPC
jgi:two-component system OmpR family response regulator